MSPYTRINWSPNETLRRGRTLKAVTKYSRKAARSARTVGDSVPHRTASASYGFEDATGEVRLKIAEHDTKRIEANTVTVMITEDISQKTVGVYLIDATTGAELAAPLTIEVAISM